MLNLSPLFYSTAESPTFLERMDLEPQERDYISSAKTAVRACLRTQLARVLRENGYSEVAVQPRFFTQGSWAYKTLNAPAQHPQQADVDDGAYLPLSFITQAGRPSVASAIFFTAAEEALKPLVKEQGWKLITDKSTCVRIEISSFAHIDIPLYAIPDEEFETLTAKALNFGYAFDEAMSRAEQDAWTALPTEKVLLAHRKENWKQSDPRPVKDWFLGEVERQGEQLRRVVRYLKGFRDWQWSSGGPSSILLMAASAPLFDFRDKRDDLALLDVVTQLPDALRDGVCNPVDSNESLTDRLGKTEVDDAANRLEAFERHLRGALNASDTGQACTWLINQLGSRFPYEPTRVKQVSVAATVLATPAAITASPLVGRTQAG